MCWSYDGSLESILDIHVIMIIWVSVTVKIPSRTILELLRNLPPIPLFRDPAKRWSTIGSINFKGIESWPSTKSYSS